MGCKNSKTVDPQKGGQQPQSVQLKKSGQDKKGKKFEMNELSQLFISYENISYEKVNLLQGAEKSIMYCPQYQIKNELFIKFTKFKVLSGQTELNLKYQLFDISTKGQQLSKQNSEMKLEVVPELLIDVTPNDQIEKGRYYLIQLECDNPWIRINISLGPVVESLTLLQAPPTSKKTQSSDWISYTTSGTLSLQGVNVTIGQEMNSQAVMNNKFNFGARYDVHFNNLQGLQHYKKDQEDEDDYAEVQLTMIVINKTSGQLIYSQMDIIPEGTELMYEDAKDLSLFISMGSEEFKKMDDSFIWVCHIWDKKSENPHNQFFSFVNFQIKNECQEVVKLLGFEQEDNKIKVEIFGKTNWMINQRYYVYVNQTMESMVKENLNQFISLKMIFDKDQQANAENAVYQIKESQQIMTQWKIKEMFKYTN